MLMYYFSYLLYNEFYFFYYNTIFFFIFFFFFQAEDGIRDGHVTGVQTCALPIFLSNDDRLIGFRSPGQPAGERKNLQGAQLRAVIGKDVTAGTANGSENIHNAEIGRASCRERV